MQSSITYDIESTAQKKKYIASGQNLNVRKGYQESEEIDHQDGEGACLLLRLLIRGIPHGRRKSKIF